jgi:hypothetical protein
MQYNLIQYYPVNQSQPHTSTNNQERESECENVSSIVEKESERTTMNHFEIENADEQHLKTERTRRTTQSKTIELDYKFKIMRYYTILYLPLSRLVYRVCLVRCSALIVSDWQRGIGMYLRYCGLLVYALLDIFTLCVDCF